MVITNQIDGTSIQEIENGFESALTELSERRKSSENMEEFTRIQSIEYELGLIRDNLRRKLKERGLINESSKDLRLLLEFPIIPETRTILKKILPEIILSLDEMRDEIIGRTSNSIEDFNCHNGTEFLQSILLENSAISRGINLSTVGELQTLQKEVGSIVGKEHRPIVLLLFYCLKGNLEELKNILKIHLREYQSSCSLEKKDCPNFFRHVRYFLEVYADISHALIKHVPIRGEKQRSIEIRTKSKETLGEILTDTRLQIAKAPISDTTTPNLFTLLKENVPWFCGGLDKTPFDEGKIPDLITFEISRERVAQSLIELNDFAYLSILRQLDTYIKQRKNQEVGDSLDSQIEKLIEKANFKFLKNVISLEEKIEKIEEYLQENNDYLYPEDHAKTTSVLIRLIKPELVFKNPVAQKQIKSMYDTLKNACDLKNNVVFAKSLEKLLGTNDPYLDLPLEEINYRSLRDLLVELVVNNFDENFINTGSNFNSPKLNKSSGRGEKKTMLRPIDAENLEKTKTPIQKNFDTAGIGIQREWIVKTAQKYYEEMWHNYRKALVFSIDILREYFGGQNYEFIFAGSGMEVFRKFWLCLPKYFKKGGNVVLGAYEYKPILHIVRKHIKNIKVVEFNSDKLVSRYVDELMSKIDLKKTKMIWFSAHTRFGDTPCSLGKESNNIDYLSQIIAKLKEKVQVKKKGKKDEYESFIPIGIDGVQSLGRTETQKILEKCKPDLYLVSTQKALGIKGVGIMAVSKDFQNFLATNRCSLVIDRPIETDSPDDHKEGTLPIENIVASSLALKKQMEKIDMFRIEGNLGEQKNRSLEEKIVKQMQDLTEYAISKFDQAEHKIIFPKHRNKLDYNGIITVQIPSDNVCVFKEKLDQLDYRINHVREISPNAFRISFHYLHNKKDIDDLLQVIQEILASNIKNICQ